MCMLGSPTCEGACEGRWREGSKCEGGRARGVAGVPADHHTFVALAMGYSRAGDLARALSVLDYMQEAGVPPATHAFNAVLRGAARAGDLPTCRALYRRLTSHGVRPPPI